MASTNYKNIWNRSNYKILKPKLIKNQQRCLTRIARKWMVLYYLGMFLFLLKLEIGYNPKIHLRRDWYPMFNTWNIFAFWSTFYLVATTARSSLPFSTSSKHSGYNVLKVEKFGSFSRHKTPILQHYHVTQKPLHQEDMILTTSISILNKPRNANVEHS